MTRTIIATALLIAAALYAPVSQAQCMPFKKVAEGLRDRHKERPVAMGAARGGATFMVFSNGETGSWTALVLLPNGCAVPLASGHQWQEIELPPAGDPA